jgi:hypothetical protein
MTEELTFGSTIDEKSDSKTKSKFKKLEFISLGQGEHIVRILEPMETKKYAHYVNYSWIACLDEQCPICENNRKILFEHPEDYRDVKEWNPRRARYSINVLDKTKTKVCEKCGEEIKADLPVCTACSTVLGEAKPLNKVKILSRGPTLFEDLKVMSRSIRNEEDEPIDIRAYDYMLVVRGEGRDTTITVIPRYFPGKEALENMEGLELFDLSKSMIVLSPEEMLDVFNGASLKDIFAVRRATKEVLKTTDVSADRVREDLNQAVEKIFKS